MASKAALADFLSEPISSARAATSCVFVIGLDIIFLLTLPVIARCLLIPENLVKRFEIDNLKVIKVSFQRKHFQGSRLDRDMHGAQFAFLLEQLQID